MEEKENDVLSWDSEINESAGNKTVILPEADYSFTVASIQRGRFPGSNKLPACPKATVQLAVSTEEGTATVYSDLLLLRKMEWKLSEFFRAIAMKKKGEAMKMDWMNAVGRTGRAHISPRTYTDSKGAERTVNSVDKYLDPDLTVEEPKDTTTADDADDIPF